MDLWYNTGDMAKKQTQKSEQISDSYVREEIKKRPINKSKLLKRTLLTALMAVLFGVIASATFLLLQPVLQGWLTPEEEVIPNEVRFPEDTEEMSPEEMLSDYMQQQAELAMREAMLEETEEEEPEEPVELPLTEEQVESILSKVTFDLGSYREMYAALRAYVREIGKTVVTITATSEDPDWLSTVQENSRQSSGVIVAENGVELLILADYTPLEDAVKLRLDFSTGYSVECKLKELDSNTNLAMLSVPLEDLDDSLRESLPIAMLGSSSFVGVGESVIAMGSPMGTAGSIGYGMVSASKTKLTQIDAADTLLQTDIYGSSMASGVLFNMAGRVVGIITTGQTGKDMGNLIAAYGITDLKKRIEKMANGEPLSYLGISGTYVTQAANRELGVPYGAYVQQVQMDSPAMQAGIMTGDVIVQMQDNTIGNFTDYVSQLQNHTVGDEVVLKVMRLSQDEYKEMEITVTIEAENEEEE